MKPPTGNKQGGQREGAGRPPKNPEAGARIKTSFTITAANLAWLDQQGESRSDIVNSFIEKARQ